MEVLSSLLQCLTKQRRTRAEYKESVPIRGPEINVDKEDVNEPILHSIDNYTSTILTGNGRAIVGFAFLYSVNQPNFRDLTNERIFQLLHYDPKKWVCTTTHSVPVRVSSKKSNSMREIDWLHCTCHTVGHQEFDANQTKVNWACRTSRLFVLRTYDNVVFADTLAFLQIHLLMEHRNATLSLRERPLEPSLDSNVMKVLPCFFRDKCRSSYTETSPSQAFGFVQQCLIARSRWKYHPWRECSTRTARKMLRF